MTGLETAIIAAAVAALPAYVAGCLLGRRAAGREYDARVTVLRGIAEEQIAEVRKQAADEVRRKWALATLEAGATDRKRRSAASTLGHERKRGARVGNGIAADSPAPEKP
jgi:hypothetical protein